MPRFKTCFIPTAHPSKQTEPTVASTVGSVTDGVPVDRVRTQLFLEALAEDLFPVPVFFAVVFAAVFLVVVFRFFCVLTAICNLLSSRTTVFSATPFERYYVTCVDQAIGIYRYRGLNTV